MTTTGDIWVTLDITVKRYASRGLQLAESQPDSPFAQIAKIAFRAEIGWAEHERGDKQSATKEFENVLRSLESFPDQSYPLFHILRLRVGHTLMWMANFIAPDQTGVTKSDPEISRPFCGVFANFDDPPVASHAIPGAPYEGFWSMLARYASWLIPQDQLRSFTDRGLAVTSKGQWYLSVWISWEARFANDLAHTDFDSAIASGINYVASERVGALLRKSRGDERSDNLYGNFQSPTRQLPSSDLADMIKAFPLRVLEPVLMTFCSLIPPPEIDSTKWKQVFHDLLGNNDLTEIALYWIKIAGKAVSGDQDSILIARHTARNDPSAGPVAHRLAYVICSSLDNIEVTECLGMQASFLIQIPNPLKQTVYAQAFTRMVQKRWGKLAQNQKFLIVSPKTYVPLIVQASSSEVPTISECARLLLIVRDAVEARWPADMLERLKSLTVSQC